MPTKKKNEYVPHISEDQAKACQVEGCTQPGMYKAPKSRDELREYQWFCLEHIREYNKQWDYFAGVDSEEIEDFIKDAVTGHRPTWTRESRVREHYRQLQDALYEFLAGTRKDTPATPPLSAKLRKNLSIMELNFPFTAQELKMQYRVMVKKYHPDVNKGDKESEEAFKRITVAYHFLSEHINNPGKAS